MKKQVLLFRGGEAKENYKDYYDYLDNIDFDPYEQKSKTWYKSFDKFLGTQFDTITVPLPNRDFADYNSWVIIFEKTIPFLSNDSILVGHSLGATFLVKYFNESNDDQLLDKIKKIILVAPAFEDIDGDLIGTFDFDKKLKKFTKIQKKVIFFGSKDDFVVPFSHLEKFNKILPNSKFNIFEDRGHFLQENFDELLQEINY